jgi:hypothetical protein
MDDPEGLLTAYQTPEIGDRATPSWLPAMPDAQVSVIGAVI